MLVAFSVIWLTVFSFILVCSWFHALCITIVRRSAARWYWLVTIDMWLSEVWLWLITRLNLFDPALTRRDLEHIRRVLR